MIRNSARLSRNDDFLKLWFGQSVSLLGTQVSVIAIPLTAVSMLHVSAFQVGLLGTAEYLPFLLVALPAGTMADRLSQRRILIASDVGRLACLLSIPVAWWLGHLAVVQLYAVGFLTGALTAFFDIAYQSLVPSLVSTERLTAANARLEVSNSAAQLGGPSIGGALVALLTAPFAILADAVSYAVSVASLLAIRGRQAPERTDAPAAEALSSLGRDILKGLRALLGHRILRPVVLCTATLNFFGDMAFALVVLFAVRDLGLSPSTLGLAMSIGAVGLLVGAMTAERVGRHLGIGATLTLTAMAFPLGLVLLAVARPGVAGVFFIATQGIVNGYVAAVYNVNAITVRQTITPPHLLGRVNASNRFIVWGVIPIGTTLGGVIGSAFGLRTAFWVAAVGASTAALWIVLSPLRSVHTVTTAEAPEAEMVVPGSQ